MKSAPIRKAAALVAFALSSCAGMAYADINVGVILSTTGPAASLGIPEKNTIALLPTSIGGHKVNCIVLDDASDTTQAVKNTRRFISENNVDVIIGSTVSPNSLSMIEVVADAQTPMMPSGPVLVASQLLADHPVRKAALEYVGKYEAAHGKESVSLFGGYAWDAGLLLQAAVPAALAKGKPGTPEFRAALRDALEATKNVSGVHGVYNMSPTDHLGLDQRARVMVKIVNGAWKYQP